MMTIVEVQAVRAALEQQMTQLVQTFEASTGCIVHSLPIHPADGATLTKVVVKVQIPE